MAKPQLAQSVTVDELPAACASEEAAADWIERNRWGDTPCCPKCGSIAVYKMTDRKTGERSARFLWRCRDCKSQYTCRTGTVLEESLIPLRKWVRVFWEATASKNGVSALEISRKVQVSYKSALFMMHRVRWAMTDDPATPDKLSGVVEADETFVGGKPRGGAPWSAKQKRKPRPKWTTKTPVVAMIQRGGDVRATVVRGVSRATLRRLMWENIERGTQIVTDERPTYKRIAWAIGSHYRVCHGEGEYVCRHDPGVHTNTIESFFARVKRGLYGTYHAVSKKHLHRYISQFAFAHNTKDLNDGDRVVLVIRKANGKRLHYKMPVTKTA